MSNITQKINDLTEIFITSLENDAKQNTTSEIITMGLHQYQSLHEAGASERAEMFDSDITRVRVPLLETLIRETEKSAAENIAESTRSAAKELLQLLRKREVVEDTRNAYAYLSLPISNLSNIVSDRVKGLLSRSGIHFIGDLVFCSEADLLDLPGFGNKSLKEIKEEFTTRGMIIGRDPASALFSPVTVSKADWQKRRKLLKNQK